MENSKELILLSRPRALPKLEPRVLARKVSSLGVGEREGDTDTLRDDCCHTPSPQSGFGAYLGAQHNSQPSFPLPTPRDVTVLQAEGAKPRSLFPYFHFWSSVVHSAHSGPHLSYTGYLSGWRLPPASLVMHPAACSWASRSLFQSGFIFSGRKILFPSP